VRLRGGVSGLRLRHKERLHSARSPQEESESEAPPSSDDPGLSIEPDAIWARVRSEGLAQAFERALRRGGLPRADHFVRTRETADPF
jgi:hypothetical protein